MFLGIMKRKTDEIKRSIASLLAHEVNVLERLCEIDDDILEAVFLLLACRGRIVVSGLGKSGYAARKIAATLSSVGHPSIFLHPTEALHGDFGAIGRDDVLVLISKSGETIEVLELLSMVKQTENPVVSITTDSDSTLAMQADIHLCIPVREEGDPLGVVPTTSVIATLAIGDAIAAGLMTARNTTYENFRFNHPGGTLGRRLSKVSQIMHRGAGIPIVPEDATLKEAIVENSRKGLGFVLIRNGQKLYILTDGDVRRAVACEDRENPLNEMALSFASSNPKSVSPDILAEEALAIMEKYRITSLVIEDDGEIVGVIHMHDILGQRFI